MPAPGYGDDAGEGLQAADARALAASCRGLPGSMVGLIPAETAETADISYDAKL